MTTKNRTYHHAARLTTVAILAFVMGALVASPARVAGPDQGREAAPVTENRSQPAMAASTGTEVRAAADGGQVFEYH